MGYYIQALTPSLSTDIFKANPLRLGWYFFSAFFGLGSYFFIIFSHALWPWKLGAALLIGFCNAIFTFIGHEILHGSVVKNQKLQTFLCFFSAMPFFISPTFWRVWHNRLHHGKTQQIIKDPDAFPTLKIYKASPFMRFMYPFTPGSGHKRSVSYFFFWFSFHILVAETYLRFRNKLYDGMDQRRVTFELVGQFLFAGALLAYAGPHNWLWVLVIPLLVQNYLLMSYIATNHNLSPLTSENDPLENSLSVTNHPILEFFSMNFGYHVEHHIFPTVNGKYMKEVHRELLKNFPDRYKVMPKWKAIRALYSTARIYKNSHELINPETGNRYPTI